MDNEGLLNEWIGKTAEPRFYEFSTQLRATCSPPNYFHDAGERERQKQKQMPNMRSITSKKPIYLSLMIYTQDIKTTATAEDFSKHSIGQSLNAQPYLSSHNDDISLTSTTATDSGAGSGSGFTIHLGNHGPEEPSLKDPSPRVWSAAPH